MEMLPERTAACSSVGASAAMPTGSLCIRSPMLLHPTAATHSTCAVQLHIHAY